MNIQKDIKAKSTRLRAGVYIISIEYNGVIVKRLYAVKEVTPATLESIKDNILYNMLCTHDEMTQMSFEEQRQVFDYLTFNEMKDAYIQDIRLNNKFLAMFNEFERKQLYIYFG